MYISHSLLAGKWEIVVSHISVQFISALLTVTQFFCFGLPSVGVAKLLLARSSLLEWLYLVCPLLS